MHKKLIIVAVLAVSHFGLFAQGSNSALKGDVPLSYISENEADIDNTFEYKVWRALSLDVKANQPLKLPKEQAKDRKNLGMVILEGIMDKYDPLPVYEYNDKEMEYGTKEIGLLFTYFNIKKEYGRLYTLVEVPGSDEIKLVDEAKNSFSVHKDSLSQNLNQFYKKNVVSNIFSVFSNKIYRYDIYEVWIFNKRYSSFKSEIRAICPYVYDADKDARVPIGWIPFKDLRRYMVQVPIKLSDMHSSKGLGQYSMDAFFSSRLYRGDIIEAENLQGKKIIDKAKTRAEVEKLREQIETDLVNLEQDIWEY